MSPTWHSDQPAPRPLSFAERLRVVRRGLPIAVVVFGGLLLSLAIRGPEAAVAGRARPWTSRLTVLVCRATLRLMGLTVSRHGRPATGAGLSVANHASWLDIFVLNAAQPLVFVAKSDVAGWPGIGWLARATGTLFVARTGGQAAGQVADIRARLASGQRLMLFPEGTSSDGRRVLPFKPTLFAAANSPGTEIQPVTLVYTAPEGEDARFYGWWGTMDFAPHLLAVLAVRRPGRVALRYHPPLATRDFSDRKHLARALESAVRSGLPAQADAATSAASR